MSHGGSSNPQFHWLYWIPAARGGGIVEKFLPTEGRLTGVDPYVMFQ